MKITNKMGYPNIWLDCASADQYDKGYANLTVTELCKPVLSTWLKRNREITLDVADLIDRIEGTALHAEFERVNRLFPGRIVEERFYTEVDGLKIGGKIDCAILIDGGYALHDYKKCSVYKHVFGKKESDGFKDWTIQANINSILMKEAGFSVLSAAVVMCFNDWKWRDAAKNEDYPQLKSLELPLLLWPVEERVEVLDRLVKDHAPALFETDVKNIRACTPDEMWERPTTWAVKKENVKTARRVLESKKLAEQWMREHNERGLYIEERKGERLACMRYCDARYVCPNNIYLGA